MSKHKKKFATVPEEPRESLHLDTLPDRLFQVARDFQKIQDFNQECDRIIERDGKLF